MSAELRNWCWVALGVAKTSRSLRKLSELFADGRMDDSMANTLICALHDLISLEGSPAAYLIVAQRLIADGDFGLHADFVIRWIENHVIAEASGTFTLV